MHILVVCNKPPYPSVDGGCLAMASTLEVLHSLGHQITCLTFSTFKHPFRAMSIPESMLKVNWIPVFVNTRIQAIGAAKHFIANKSYIMHRFIQADVSKTLENLLLTASFDLAHLESLFTLPYASIIRKKGIPVVYRAHNIEHLIWNRTAKISANPLKRWYLSRESHLLEQEELSLIAACDSIMAITPQDQQWMIAHFPNKPCTAIPMPAPFPDKSPPPPSPVVYHLGAMDWLPNEEAMRWLLNDIWPLVIQTLPGAQLHIAGKSMPDWLRNHSSQGVTIQGYVQQVTPYLLDKGILAVPLRSGSGLRIKIVEAMANGKAIITTSQGLEGIAAQHGKEVWIAEDASSFAAGLIALIQDGQLRATLAANGQSFVEKHYSMSAVKQAVTTLYETTITA